MARQLLRVPPAAWELIKKALELCGEEGQLRIRGRHLVMDDLALEADPYILSRIYKSPDEYDAWRNIVDDLDLWMGGKIPKVRAPE